MTVRRVQAIFQFYTGFAPAGCWLVTIACGWVVFKWGMNTLSVLLLLKLLAWVLLYVFVQHNKRKELYFYYNMGLSKQALFIGAFIIDLMLFAIVLYVINLL
jgi:hypothetical protein